MSPTNHDSEGDAVLIAFSDTPAADLADEMRRHPEHARDLVRLSMARWAGDEAAIVPAAAAAEEARVREIGRNVFRDARQKSAAAAAAPLTSLRAAAEARGLDADALAAQLDVPIALFWKLHRCLVAPDSLPRALIKALAGLLNRTESEIAALLSGPPTLAQGASYRADSTPHVAARQTFADALAADPDATDAQRARWRNGSGGI